jgi:DNA-binding HxlR family transcriptional regulator
MSSQHLDLLQNLGQHRWTVPLLAWMAPRGGARFVELLKGLGLARESLSRTLEAALQAGWLMRNPGHGHPLRPEYILTPAGQSAAKLCAVIETARAAIELPDGALHRWSLPVLYLVDHGTRRFAGLAQALPDSNPGALTQSLKGLLSQSLLTRTIVESFPPVPDYGLSRRGAELAQALEAA